MVTQASINEAIRAWQKAATELSIEVTAPFILRGKSQEHQFIAWVPHFYPHGVLVGAIGDSETLKEDVKNAGYVCSFINPEVYKSFNRELFIETLRDWGYYGPEDKRPTWFLSDDSGTSA